MWQSYPMARTESTQTEMPATGKRPTPASPEDAVVPRRRRTATETPTEPVRKTRTMSDEHRMAITEARRESGAVRAYLDAWEMHRPKRGRKRSPEAIRSRIAIIDTELLEASAFDRLHLLQERADLEQEVVSLESGADLSSLEDAFVEVAAAYGRRRGITYETWRQIGVRPELLKRAGIARTG